MARREVKATYGAVTVENQHGIRLSIEDGENSASVPLSTEAARELGEFLQAFAIVNKQTG
jgi:hypothetical protein